MNLDDVKTGDRLWTMMLQEEKCDPLTDLEPQEVICSKADGLPLQDDGQTIAGVMCTSVVDGISLVAPVRDLYPTREEAIRQALAAINERSGALLEASKRYTNMMYDTPA